MAAPLEYADKCYLNLHAALDDGSPVTVSIDRYLNVGPLYKTYPRNVNADKAKDALLDGMANELKVDWRALPPVFQIDGATYNLSDLRNVFFGKGSPEAIRSVIRLASRYKRTDAATVREYCTKNIGLDCNGFACNFWGTPTGWEIGRYDVNRRQAVEELVAGDAMIFYHKVGNAVVGDPYHIAVVDEVNVIRDKFQVVVAQSAGETVGRNQGEQGLQRFDYGTLTPQNMPSRTGPGDLFTDTTADGVPNTRIFFAAGPARGKPNV